MVAGGCGGRQSCGKIKYFRRTIDPVTGFDKPFGFCEYESPDSVPHAVRVLNGLPLFNETLLVKVDSKTQAYAERYAEAKRAHHKAIGQPISRDDEQRESERCELTARRVIQAQLDRLEHIRARVPKPGHPDGRRATPEPDDPFLSTYAAAAAAAAADDDGGSELSLRPRDSCSRRSCASSSRTASSLIVGIGGLPSLPRAVAP